MSCIISIVLTKTTSIIQCQSIVVQSRMELLNGFLRLEYLHLDIWT